MLLPSPRTRTRAAAGMIADAIERNLRQHPDGRPCATEI